MAIKGFRSFFVEKGVRYYIYISEDGFEIPVTYENLKYLNNLTLFKNFDEKRKRY